MSGSGNQVLDDIMRQLQTSLPAEQHAAIASQLSAQQQQQQQFLHPSAPLQSFGASSPGQYRPPPPQGRPSPAASSQSHSTPSQPPRRPVGRPPNSSRPPPPPPQPIYASQQYAPAAPQPPLDPHAYYVFPTPLPIQPFPSGGQPLPPFPTFSTNRQRNAQAMHTTYPSRLRTGVSTLMQPIVPFTAAAATKTAGGTRAGGRGRAVNYAEIDGDAGDSEDDESSSSSSGGGEEGGDKNEAEPETNYGSRRVPVAARLGGGRAGSRRDSGTPGGGGEKDEGGGGGKRAKKGGSTEKSYLGEIPPGDKVVIKPMTKTKHEYHTESQLEAAALRKTILIPIRIDFDTDSHRIRDCFTWNLNETLLTPLQFARIFCHDLELPMAAHAEIIAAQIKAQLDEFASVAEMEVGYDENVSAATAAAATTTTTSGTEPHRSHSKAHSQQPEDVDGSGGRKRKREREETIPEEDEVGRGEEGGEGAETGTGGLNTTAGGTPAGTPGGTRTGTGTSAEEMEGDENAEEGEGGAGGVGEGEEEEGEEEEEEEEQEEEHVEMESDCRIIVNLDVQIATHNLRDRIEWDLSSPLLPETFATLLCTDLGLSGESIPLVSHAIHEELLKHKKDAIEMGLVGAGWRDVQAGSSRPGPRKLVGVWRGFEEQEDFAPVLIELTGEDIEKREVERERASRRARRDTARFTSNSASVRFRRR